MYMYDIEAITVYSSTLKFILKHVQIMTQRKYMFDWFKIVFLQSLSRSPKTSTLVSIKQKDYELEISIA